MLERAIIDINKLEGLCKYQVHITGCNSKERKKDNPDFEVIVFENIGETHMKCIGCPHSNVIGNGDVEIIESKGRIMGCPYNPRFEK